MTTTTTTVLGPLQTILERRRPEDSSIEKACMATIERALPPEVISHLQTRLAIIEAAAEGPKPVTLAYPAVLMLSARLLSQMRCELMDENQWRKALTERDLRAMEQQMSRLNGFQSWEALQQASVRHLWAAVFFDAMDGALGNSPDSPRWQYHLQMLLFHAEAAMQNCFIHLRQGQPYGQIPAHIIETLIPTLEDAIIDIIRCAVAERDA